MAKYEIEVHDDLLDRFLVTLHADRWHSQVQQIALQRRIPEPGPWAVVEASAIGFPNRQPWVNYQLGLSGQVWADVNGHRADWHHMVNPTLIRAGLDPDLILEDKS
jgi:hypothetical protein